MRNLRVAGAILIAAQGVVWAASADLYRGRRASLAGSLKDGAVVLFGRSAQEAADAAGRFSQEPNFYYLTGWREPGAALLLAPQVEVLFVPPASASRELYYGKVTEPEGFQSVSPAEKLESELRAALERAPRLYTLGEANMARLKALAPLREVRDALPAITAMRMRKSPGEVALIEKAAAVSMAAHRALWKRATSGLHEYQLAATLISAFLERGCEGPAYWPIVGSGPNGLVLHYARNNRRMDRGELVVVDAAAQCDGYAADITRTFPVGGRFSKRQREIYEIVLGAQKATIAAVKPGVTLADLTRTARDYMDGHGSLGKYLKHGVSHHVGLEVHDAADTAAPLADGMVVTIEPGMYIPEENIAIRIEDMVLVTGDGARVLTASLPKEPQEIEKAVAK